MQKPSFVLNPQSVRALIAMEDKICAVVLWHFKIFRFCCFSSISLNSNPRVARHHESWLFLWAVVLIVIINAVGYSFFKYQLYFSETTDLFGSVVNVINTFVTCLTMQLFILEPLFKRKHERAFWRHYIRLTSVRQLSSKTVWAQMKEYKQFLVKFYVYFLVNQILDTTILYCCVEHVTFVLILWTVTLPYVYFLRCRTMHLIFNLDLISNELCILDDDLQTLGEYTKLQMFRPNFTRFGEYLRQQIVEKQHRYEEIFGMVESFKHACGLSIIANYFKYYVRVLVSCYWLYFTWYNSQLTGKNILLIPAILEIPMFLLTAKNCMNAAKLISYRVHSLKHRPDNLAVSVQIQNFSLQLLHQQIKIDGLGIAAMDGYMLTKAVGSITTYMVFFIQFMPKFKSKFD